MRRILFLFLLITSYSANAQNYTWAKSMGLYDGGWYQTIAYDNAGHVYVAGYFTDSMNVDGTVYYAPSDYEAFVTKFDTSGNEIWTTVAGGVGDQTIHDIAIDNNGDAYFCGSYSTGAVLGSTTFTGSGIYVAKISSAGTIIEATTSTGPNYGEPLGMCIKGNELWVTGNFFNVGADYINFGSGDVYGLDGSAADIFVTKYNISGPLTNVWCVNAGASTSSSFFPSETGQDIVADNSGNVYVCGNYTDDIIFNPLSATPISLTFTGSSDRDVFTAMFDGSGNALWAIKGGGNGDDYPNAIALNDANQLFIAGAYTANANFSGTILTNSGGYDAFLVRYDLDVINNTANLGFAKRLFGPSDQEITSLATRGGEVFGCGVYNSSMTAGSTTITASSYTAFHGKFDTDGNPLWFKVATGAASEIVNDICVDEGNGLYSLGYYGSNPIVFNAGTLELPTITGASYSMFLDKITDCDAPMISSSGTSFCSGGSINLTAVTSAPTVAWSTGATTTNIAASTEDWYYVTATHSSGCKASSMPIYLSAVSNNIHQPVCYVTVDSATANFTKVLWEFSPDPSIDSIIVYREISTGVYGRMGAVLASAPSVFDDMTADPNATAYRYRLTTKDTCGNETSVDSCLYHNTIHLQYLGSGNFQWTYYNIESMTTPVTNYVILRDDLASGVFNSIGSVPGSQNTFTDVASGSFPSAVYRVEVVWSLSCSPTRAGVSTSRSNIRNKSVISGLNEKEETDFLIMPNPSNGNFILTLNNELLSGGILTVNDLTGRTIYTSTVTDNKTYLNLEHIASGQYMVTITKGSTKTNHIIHKL